MNALARYLLVFLLGWSGAVWSYSDVIYKTSKTPEKTETHKSTNDLSLPDALKPQPTVNNESISQNAEDGPSATTIDNTQQIEDQGINQ